jgi:predicted membrane GTPase involved in stress response
VKPFTEQHPESRRTIVKHLSKVAIRGICAELSDISSENVHTVTLAVSGYLRRELIKYCTDDSVLQHASLMMTRMYGKSLTCKVSMNMKGIQRLGLKIAERGSIVELYGLSNLNSISTNT